MEGRRHQKTECLGYTQALPLLRDTPLMAGLDGKPLRNTDGK
ncbi:hypothetical protein [Hyalangium sp.]|nr:hypothetical protein [Hyalangium sp.]HYI01144.1 hypothetical protein [Hyalangium sp.]